MTSPLMLGVALVVLPFVAYAAIRWQRALFLALPFLVALDGVGIGTDRLSARLSQLAACALLIPLVGSAALGTRRLKTDATMWWLAAILAANVVATALNSPVPGYSARQCVNLAATWLIYVVVVNFADTRDDLAKLVRNVLWAAIGASGIAIGAYLLALAGFSIGGAEVSESAVEHLTNAYGAYGTMLEPNLLGSFAGAHLVLAIVLVAVGTQHPVAAQHRALARWTAAFTAVALVLSFTRAAWLGAVAGLLSFVVLGPRAAGVHVRVWRILGPVGLGLVVAIALLLIPSDAGTLFRFKLLNLINLGSQTAALRLVTYAIALQQVVAHPVIGSGTFSFAALTAQGVDFQQFDNWRNLWIGNFLVLALHDTGAVGLVLWGGMLWSVLSRGLRSARRFRGADLALAGPTLGLTLATASLLVPFMTTTGFTIGYPWLLMGVLGAYSRVASAEIATPVPATPAPPSLEAATADAT